MHAQVRVGAGLPIRAAPQDKRLPEQVGVDGPVGDEFLSELSSKGIEGLAWGAGGFKESLVKDPSAESACSCCCREPL